jgi:flagellin
MALTVATNTGALMAQAAASSTNKSMEISMERLATGKRINSAADDAAGVAIASRLTSEIKGTNQAIRNAMDGQALLDTAEGAHIEIENILQRMRELAVQAGNDSNNTTDRTNITNEISQLTNEIDRIASTTTWAGQNLLDGTGTFNFQVGSRTTNADSMTTAINSMSASGLSLTTAQTATAATASTGTTQSGSVITVGAVLGATVLDADKQAFSSGILSYSTSGGAGVSLSQANNVLTLDLGTTVASSAVTVTINGTAFTESMTSATATETLRSVVADALMDKVIAHFGNGTAGASALATIGTANTTTGAQSITMVTNSLAEDLRAQLNADTSYSAGFTNADASAATITSTAKVLKSSVSIGTIAETGAVATDPTASVSGDNVLTFAAASSATIDATNNHTFSVTIDGIATSFNTFTDGKQKGYDMTDIATNGGITGALKQKLVDNGFKAANIALGAATLTFTKGGALDVSSSANAKVAIDAIDVAITTVNSQRATLGSVSNRLDSTVSNLTNISANLQAGRGRIEDADFAAETTNLAKSQILQQASTAMLAQANASKQGVLSLLQG